MTIEFDYSKLKGRIIEKYGCQKKFAKAWKKSGNTVSKKLNNKFRFSSDDIIEISSMLEIPPQEIGKYFFTLKV